MSTTLPKYFITANELLLDSFKLAKAIFDSGYRPDFIIGIWRGGAPVGIAVQEYFEYMNAPTDHIAIRTTSYTGIDQQDNNIRVLGLNYIVDKARQEDNILLVDDVFDTGRSIQAVINELSLPTTNITANNIKIACPWYKPKRNKTAITPDFYLHETNDWLVFPHELDGLSLAEIRQSKPDLASVILD